MKYYADMELDRAEKQILRLLQRNGRSPNAELAQAVGLSESPCFRRVKRLEADGVIRHYAAVLDQRKLGLDVTAFVWVTLERQNDSDIANFLGCVDAESHIVECHATSGSHDYLMKVVARNIDHFSDLVMHRILKFPGVKNVESSFSLSAIKESFSLPCN